LIPALKQQYLHQYGAVPEKPFTQQIQGAGQPAHELFAAINGQPGNIPVAPQDVKHLISGNLPPQAASAVVKPDIPAVANPDLGIVQPRQDKPGIDMLKVGTPNLGLPDVTKGIKLLKALR